MDSVLVARVGKTTRLKIEKLKSNDVETDEEVITASVSFLFEVVTHLKNGNRIYIEDEYGKRKNIKIRA